MKPLEYPKYPLPSAEETRRIASLVTLSRCEPKLDRYRRPEEPYRPRLTIAECAAKAGVPMGHWEELEAAVSPGRADELLPKAARVLGIGMTKGGDADV